LSIFAISEFFEVLVRDNDHGLSIATVPLYFGSVAKMDWNLVAFLELLHKFFFCCNFFI